MNSRLKLGSWDLKTGSASQFCDPRVDVHFISCTPVLLPVKYVFQRILGILLVNEVGVSTYSPEHVVWLHYLPPLNCDALPTNRAEPHAHFQTDTLRALDPSLALCVVLKIFFINFGCLGSSLLCGLCLVVASGGCSLVVVLRLLIAVTSLVAEHGL